MSPYMVKLPCGLCLAQADEHSGGGEGRHDLPRTMDQGDLFLFPLFASPRRILLKRK